MKVRVLLEALSFLDVTAAIHVLETCVRKGVGVQLPQEAHMDDQEIEFLQESNYIEGVRDGLDDSVKAWKFIKTKKNLTMKNVLKTHQILMQKYLKEKAGAWRTEPVWIGGRQGKLWYAIPNLMENWCRAASEKAGLTHNMIVQYHVDYEGIHPFIDGNGRTGRIFMNWQRLNIGLPILVIKEEDKWDYYKWFQKEA